MHVAWTHLRAAPSRTNSTRNRTYNATNCSRSTQQKSRTSGAEHRTRAPASRAGASQRFMGLVHHTDAEREYAYDRQSHIGKLDKALDEANAKGWTVVDMKGDWKHLFAFEP